MFKISLISFAIMFIALFMFAQSANAEEIHFNKDIFILKNSEMSPVNNGYENDYFLKNENKNNWTKMVGIYHYPNVSDPIKFAENADKEIEAKDTNVLLKFIQNKKQNKSALSYLQNGSTNGQNYFEYNVFKYEKHPDKGMMVLRYAIRYYFVTDAEITQIGNKVKEENDTFLKEIIQSPIPPIIERDINVS